MPKITFNLDHEPQDLANCIAQADGLSKSSVAAVPIQKFFTTEWAKDCFDLAGSSPDFPLMENSCFLMPPDILRVKF